MLLLAILAFSLPKAADAAMEVNVSVIEVNHCMDGMPNSFTQVILWQWSSIYRRHDVITWWIMDGNRNAPTRARGGWVVEKEVNGKKFRFISGVKIETWTQHDPERANQKLRKEFHRLKLGDLPKLERFAEINSSEN